MTDTATTPTDLRAAFDFHAHPFTREVATDDRLRLPFLDTTLALMPAALIAPADTGKTALLRRLHTAAQLDFAPVVGSDRDFPATSYRPSTSKGNRR